MIIYLEKPAVEEYIIHNKCPFDVELRKYNYGSKKLIDKDPILLKKEAKMAIVWDERDITDRQIQVKHAQISKTGYISLDKVSE